jgi:hypothetical protein
LAEAGELRLRRLLDRSLRRRRSCGRRRLGRRLPRRRLCCGGRLRDRGLGRDGRWLRDGGLCGDGLWLRNSLRDDGLRLLRRLAEHRRALAADRVLELAHPGADGATDFRKTPGTEDEQQHDQQERYVEWIVESHSSPVYAFFA